MSRSKNDPEMLEARLRYFIGCSLVVILGGTIFAVLYSLVFITQPLEVSPNDQKFFDSDNVGTLPCKRLGFPLERDAKN